ncbi:MAG: uracil-DNA glycosylase [Gammaproteobacteria bacterium]|nr:MAG: uracil-DNA glycosylase [Gammaproteobacteria bacterium]
MSAEARRRAYLEALDIDVWTPRGADPAGAMEEVEVAPQALATDWDGLRQQVAACTLCSLNKSRTQTVFGVGNQSADWMIVGEAPGAEEDRRGEPFVGRAGKLLDEMLRAVGLQRDAVFIANILKCRPPNNRDPLAEEASSCRAYLERQIQLARPKLILAVGRVAAQHLLGSDAPVGRLRGQKHTLNGGQLPVVVTYHPAYLLRSPTQKRKVWQDLCMARQIMEQPDQ